MQKILKEINVINGRCSHSNLSNLQCTRFKKSGMRIRTYECCYIISERERERERETERERERESTTRDTKHNG